MPVVLPCYTGGPCPREAGCGMREAWRCSPMGDSWRLRSRWGMSSSPASSWWSNDGERSRYGRDRRDVRRNPPRTPGGAARSRAAHGAGGAAHEPARDLRPAPARGREPERRASAAHVVRREARAGGGARHRAGRGRGVHAGAGAARSRGVRARGAAGALRDAGAGSGVRPWVRARARGRRGDGAAAGARGRVCDGRRPGRDGRRAGDLVVAHPDRRGARRPGVGRARAGSPVQPAGRGERGAGRGRTIGVPTINLTSPDPRKLLPPDGVYAVRVEIDGKRYDGMMNQGPRPTFGVHARGLEIHLFDFTGDVYGASVTVAWARRLRDTQTFPSRQALVDQIERDAIAARAVLKG